MSFFKQIPSISKVQPLASSQPHVNPAQVLEVSAGTPTYGYYLVNQDEKGPETRMLPETQLTSQIIQHNNLHKTKALGSQVMRFVEFFSLCKEVEFKLGDVEPLSLRSVRPFLLVNELALSKSAPKMKGKNNKANMKKGKNGKMVRKGKSERSRVNDFSEKNISVTSGNPLPAMNAFIRSNQPYNITQELTITTAFSNSTASATFAGFNFLISNLDQTSSLVAVFDQYRIECIEIWLIPQEVNNTSGTYGTGLLYSVTDYDDANALTTIGQANDYTNVMVTPAQDIHYRKFVPHCAVAIFSGAFTSYENVVSPWIDASSTGVQHYGIKVACGVVGAAQNYNLQVRYHCQWRNVR